MNPGANAGWLNRVAEEWKARRELGINVASLALERVARLGVGLLVSSLLARHLGAERFGQMNLGLALGAIGMSVASLGLDVVLVRVRARRPGRAAALFAAALVLRSGAFVLVSFAMAAWIAYSSPEEPVAVFWFSLSALGAVAGIPALWFQAVGRARVMAAAQFGVFLTASAGRLGAVAAGSGLGVFGGIALGEIILGGVVMGWMWRREVRQPRKSAFKRGAAMCRSLAGRGLPWWGTAVGVMVFSRLDQVLLHELAGATEVGLLAVSIRLTEQTYLLPMALGVPMLGRLAAGDGAPAQARRVRRYLACSAVAGYFCLAVLWLAGPSALSLLFGSQFDAAGEVVRVQALGLPWIFVAVARGQVLAASGRGGGGALFGAVVGAVVSCALNLALTPRWGALGAAWAGVGAQVAASFLSGFFVPGWRWLAVLQLRALIAPWRLWRS